MSLVGLIAVSVTGWQPLLWCALCCSYRRRSPGAFQGPAAWSGSPGIRTSRSSSWGRNLACRPDGGFELCLGGGAGGVLGRHVHLCRGTPAQFAAILPGDGVAEVVLTSGLNNFL